MLQSSFRTDCHFSPSDKMVISGISVGKKGSGTGQLMFFDRETLKPVTHIEVSESVSIIIPHFHIFIVY